MSASRLFVAGLKRALAAPGCPLCTFGRDDDDHYLHSLLREGFSSADLLGRLARSQGLCREHAWALQRLEQSEWHDGLTHAGFEQPLLADARAWLDRLPVEGRARRRAPKTTGQCPACFARDRTSQGRISAFAEALADEQVTRLYARRAQGLCMPHFRLLWQEEMPGRVRESLREHQRACLQELLERLARYEDKHDYRVTEPPSPEEEASWTDAVAALSGDHPRERPGDRSD